MASRQKQFTWKGKRYTVVDRQSTERRARSSGNRILDKHGGEVSVVLRYSQTEEVWLVGVRKKGSSPGGVGGFVLDVMSLGWDSHV